MNSVAFYANTILWLYVVITYEQRGAVWAHKVRVMISQDFGCRCTICHPEAHGR